MKKLRKNVFLLLKILILTMLTAFCIIKTNEVKTAVYDAVMRCLTIIIPSLYGMMMISGILVKSGIIKKIPGILPVFAVSQFAGYPVGAKMICAGSDSNMFNKKRAELLSGVCFGAGPAFIFGCISSQLYGDPSAGKIILISTVSANIILAVIISCVTRNSAHEPEKNHELDLSSDMITKCILNSGKAMADICIMITAFSVLTAFLDSFGFIDRLSNIISKFFNTDAAVFSGIIRAFLDVTAISGLPDNDYTLLPIISGLVSFGGICVIMQISALTSGKIRIMPIVLIRITASILSSIICRIVMPIMLSGNAVSAGNFSVHKAASPVPSIILIIMTIIVFREYERLPKELHLHKNNNLKS